MQKVAEEMREKEKLKDKEIEKPDIKLEREKFRKIAEIDLAFSKMSLRKFMREKINIQNKLFCIQIWLNYF